MEMIDAVFRSLIIGAAAVVVLINLVLFALYLYALLKRTQEQTWLTRMERELQHVQHEHKVRKLHSVVKRAMAAEPDVAATAPQRLDSLRHR